MSEKICALLLILATCMNAQISSTDRQRVIQTVIANLKAHYIDPGVAEKIAEAIQAHDYSAVTDGAALADLLTKQMRDVSHDLHLVVVYSATPAPDRPPAPTPEIRERYRNALLQENCTFERVTLLAHNIGYLKLNSFPDSSICESTATTAMASLNNSDAIIIDLRDNRGGYPNMVMLLAAYFFDHPEFMFSPIQNVSEQSWTHSPVPGNKLADKPVYVLISPKAISAAEHFCYNMKMLKRATFVGETTGGAAHAGRFYRIDEHFGMAVTEIRPINPFAKSDWEGVGIEPDVKVSAANALEKAQELTEARLRKK